MTMHTSGPWLFDEKSEAITTHNRIANGKTRIASVTLGWVEPFESEQIANARLIAAAPDLLEALDGMLQVYGGKYDGEMLPKSSSEIELIDIARAAIARATGESE